MSVTSTSSVKQNFVACLIVVHLTDVFLTNPPLHNNLIVNTVNTNDGYVVEKS